MNVRLEISEPVAAALNNSQPVVALESTVISHGLPWPHNLETARELEAIVRAKGAVPATIALAEGRVQVGLSDKLLHRLAREEGVAKVSRRDYSPVLASGGLGATTVAGTLIAAQLAGIRVFATGGIGGVHRSGQDSLDISADLSELARARVAVVCAGAKAILDLGRTLEVLETLGVPVIGYGCDNLPAFYYPDSGLPLEYRADSAQELAAVLKAHWELGLSGGLVIAQPPPAGSELPRQMIEAQIEQALDQARERGLSGKRITPFLLQHLAELSGRKSLETNLALLRNNAALAAEVALACAG